MRAEPLRGSKARRPQDRPIGAGRNHSLDGVMATGIPYLEAGVGRK